MLSKTVFTPGPTQVPYAVLKAITSYTTYHRSDEFKKFHKSLIEKLKKIFYTEQNLNILTCSGTGAMEAAVTNFCNPDDKVLYVNQGRFGYRWGSICKAHGLNAKEVLVNEGYSLSIKQAKLLNLNDVAAIFLTHTETSTATLTDIKKISEYIKENSKSLVIVDSVTSVGAIEFKMDEWGIDVAVSASQKGLLTPPGISVIAYSGRAKEKMMNGGIKRFYFDLRKELAEQKTFLTMWTPAIGLFYGLNAACDILLKDGLKDVWKRVHSMAEYFRNEMVKKGCELFSKSPSDALTAILMPDSIPASKLVNMLQQKYGVHIAGGQAELTEKIVRVSHMGDLTLDDTIELTEIIKNELTDLRNSAIKPPVEASLQK